MNARISKLLRSYARITEQPLSKVKREWLITPSDKRGEVADVMRCGVWSSQLRGWRKKCDLIQKEAADRLNVPIDTYRGWESMNSTPPKFVRMALERLMTVPQEVSRTD
jgi:DNA-binding transcriptional regulator YiaG